ncbi:hypothetical protein [Nocardia sp. alder85J]|uniref:hypothetical protein n=1 Tax=Nocardia sp. alder85J TaxID=2862949 RepID=UPI001CD29D7B|nr:hypothetical protein [Nocardia sp. alder85J]MCX4097719.1 hypothetical protein [Nocardia sp. alder85J]
MNEHNHAADLRGRYHREIRTVSQFCSTPIHVVYTGSPRGWAIEAVLANGLVARVTNDAMQGTEYDSECWTDLHDADGVPVAYIDRGSLTDQLSLATALTIEQAASLCGGLAPAELPDLVQMEPHTVVVDSRGHRLEVINVDSNRECIRVCDRNGSRHGTSESVVLTRAQMREWITTLGRSL